ncbi:hypothetical protein [Oenococcus oeni]|uniref:hypothetical protein n=1 Tax=Oenococcus oeni TaxID=1247 RepID=UPI00100A7C28|nr:hypothetical protein [Oenococcus oeni]
MQYQLALKYMLYKKKKMVHEAFPSKTVINIMEIQDSINILVRSIDSIDHDIDSMVSITF